MIKTDSEPLWSSLVLWLAAALVVLACAASGCSCAPRSSAPNVREASAQELSSVVTLETLTGQWQVSGEIAGAVHATWAPYCTAFAVERFGRTRLVTAAHCLTFVKLSVGAEAHYREPSGWGLGSATVALVDAGRDYSELTLTEGAGLVALKLGPAPCEGQYLISPSSFFGEATIGRAQPGAGTRFTFDGRIEHGWSGSPVLDTRGRAVGLVTSCLAVGGQCGEGVVGVAL